MNIHSYKDLLDEHVSKTATKTQELACDIRKEIVVPLCNKHGIDFLAGTFVVPWGKQLDTSAEMEVAKARNLVSALSPENFPIGHYIGSYNSPKKVAPEKTATWCGYPRIV